MSFLCLGLSHHTAPLGVLEAASFDSEQMTRFLVQLCEGGAVGEAVGLSTCNRTEFYLDAADGEAARARLMELLAACCATSASVLAEHLYLHRDAAAVRHQFRVASGVDSLIVGEREILGQLRAAMELAESAGTAPRTLCALFQRGLRVGRRAHAETLIGRGNVSVASVAVSIAGKIFSELADKRLLLIGAGQTAKLALANLSDSGVGSVVIANRSRSRAMALAERCGAAVIGLEDIPAHLADVDLVVAATGSQEFLVTHEMVARHRPRGKTQVYIDLSLPRNIDPSLAKFPQAFVYGIEDLEGLARENKALREAEIGKVEAIIDEECGRFMQWVAHSSAEQLAVALRRRVEAIRREHLERHAAGLPEETRARFDRFSQSLMKSVFHDLTINLKRLDPQSESGRRQYEMARRLLNIPAEEEKAEGGRMKAEG